MTKLIFCTLPEVVEDTRVVMGFESIGAGLVEVTSFFLESDGLQGIAPLYVANSIERGLAWLDSLTPPTQADIDYIASL